MLKPLDCRRCHGRFASQSTLTRHVTHVRAPAGQTRCRTAEEMRYMGMHEGAKHVWFHSDNPRWAWSPGHATLDHPPAASAPASTPALSVLDDLMDLDDDEDLDDLI